MYNSRRSLRRSIAFAAATLVVLTMFAIAPMISGSDAAPKQVSNAPF